MLSAFKNFGVTFLIAALLFGIIAYFATSFVTGTVNNIMSDEEDELSKIMQNTENQTPVDSEEEAETTSDVLTGEKIPEGESFNFLVITTDYRPDIYDDYKPSLDLMYMTDWYSVNAADTAGCLSTDYREIRASSILLVRVDKEARQYTYTYFSPETQVYTPSGYHTLAEVYNFYGKQTVADHINAMTGISINYTILLNAYNFDELAELCGVPTVTIDKDIYQSGKIYTTQYEITAERIGEDGETWTEHIPNTFILGEGEVQLDETNLSVLTGLSERSMSDITSKEAYSVEILKGYFTLFAQMEESQLKGLFAQLITNKSEWGNIEGLNYTEPEPEPVTESAEEEPYNPWEDNFVNTSAESDASEENSGEETEEKKLWVAELAEPDGPVLETNYTMNDFDNIYELIGAVTYFENVIISYPGEFKSADDGTAAYFDPDITKGLAKFLEYR